jgi:iron complex outermembrane receptor protein
VSVYDNEFDNMQIQSQFPLPPPNTSVISAVLNAGGARAYGLEAELIYKPVPELTLNATAALTKAEFTDFNYFGRPSRFYPNAEQDLSGNQIPRTPDSKVTIGAAYDFVIGGFGTLTPQANATISSSYYNTDYNTPIDKQDAYTLVDASLRWTSESGKFSLEAFGTNLTDEAVLNYGAFGSRTLITSYAPPRFYGLRASFRSQ